MALEGSSSVLWVVRATKSVSIGALIVQSLELFNHIPEEIDYLWRTPFKLVTCLYALYRYFPLCVQIVNLTLAELIYANPRPKLCLFAFTLKIISGQFMSTCIEAILMIRANRRATVHTLYKRSLWTGLFLLAIMIIGTSLEVTGTALTVAGLVPGPTGTICSRKQPPFMAIVAFTTGAGIIQATLVVMTITRIARYRKIGWLRTPLVALVLRDGILMFLAWTTILVVLITLKMVRGEDVTLWNAVFSWYVALLSIVGCRLVLNVRTAAIQDQQNNTITGSVQFSSFFED